MSVSTTLPSFDDFDAWEQELATPATRTFRPTRAAERRSDREVIERQLGIVRHRNNEREV